jgi:hypothetical protein
MQMIHGVIHGRTIKLTADPGLAEGIEVDVILRPTQPATTWGEGLRRCAGALADSWTSEDDEILAELEQDRQRSVERDLPE